MKKFLILLTALSLLGCNDGDFEVPTFEFTDTVNQCGDNVLLFKLSSSGTESLILTLSSTDLEAIAQTQSNLSLNTTRTITYRVFDDAATTTYFCSLIPQTTPKVLKSWEATEGYLEIVTEENSSTEFTHTINIYDLVLINGDDKMVFDEYTFGSITITY